MDHRNLIARGAPSLIIAALAFAMSSPLALMAEPLDPIAVSAIRMWIGSLCLFALSPRATICSMARLSLRHRLQLLGVGAILAAHQAGYLLGLSKTSLPAAVCLVSVEPVAVVLVARMAFRSRLRPLEVLGLLAAVLGSILVAGGGGAENHAVGNMLVIVAVVLYGVYIAAARHLRNLMPVIPYAACVFGASALLLTPFAVARLGNWADVPPNSWWAVFALGTIPTLIGHTLIQRSAREMPAAAIALVSPGETIGSLAIGAWLLHTWPTARMAFGGSIIIAGVLTTGIAVSRRKD